MARRVVSPETAVVTAPATAPAPAPTEAAPAPAPVVLGPPAPTSKAPRYFKGAISVGDTGAASVSALRIKVLVANPKQPGSLSHARWEATKGGEGMTVAEYVAAVGAKYGMPDIRWALARGYLTLWS